MVLHKYFLYVLRLNMHMKISKIFYTKFQTNTEKVMFLKNILFSSAYCGV